MTNDVIQGFSDGVGGTADAVIGIVELKLIEKQIEQDAEKYDLTDSEISRLRDAYILESTYGGGVHAFRSARNFIAEHTLESTPLISSGEIKEQAAKRKESKALDTQEESVYQSEQKPLAVIFGDDDIFHPSNNDIASKADVSEPVALTTVFGSRDEEPEKTPMERLGLKPLSDKTRPSSLLDYYDTEKQRGGLRVEGVSTGGRVKNRYEF